MDLSALRAQYERARFDVADVDRDPYVQFRRWYDAVVDAGYVEPWAMVLATVGPDGWPSARNVLLRGLSPQGFDFYTNYTSDKARDIENNGRATAVFSWNLVHRQVRIVGTASRVSDEESDAYFAGRPRGAQISAWASDQSEVVADRATARSPSRGDRRTIRRRRRPPTPVVGRVSHRAPCLRVLAGPRRPPPRPLALHPRRRRRRRRQAVAAPLAHRPPRPLSPAGPRAPAPFLAFLCYSMCVYTHRITQERSVVRGGDQRWARTSVATSSMCSRSSMSRV